MAGAFNGSSSDLPAHALYASLGDSLRVTKFFHTHFSAGLRRKSFAHANSGENDIKCTPRSQSSQNFRIQHIVEPNHEKMFNGKLNESCRKSENHEKAAKRLREK